MADNDCGKNWSFSQETCILELFAPREGGRIANSSNLIMGLYCYTTFVYFPVKNGGSRFNLWQLDVGERGQLELKDKQENMPLDDRVSIVAEIYRAVYQQHLRNQTRATKNLWAQEAQIDVYYCTL